MSQSLYPSILHYGAVAGVTGSCHELQINSNNSVLIDCGLFQGAETSPGDSHDSQLRIDFRCQPGRVIIAGPYRRKVK